MSKLILQSTSVIKTKLNLQPGGKIHTFLTNECYRRMNKYVPMDTGNLRTVVTVMPGKIIYEMPYAHYQYIGKLYVDPITRKGAFYNPDYGFWSRPNVAKEKTNTNLNQKNGGPYWDKKMWSAEGKEVIKTVQNYMGGKK